MNFDPSPRIPGAQDKREGGGGGGGGGVLTTLTEFNYLILGIWSVLALNHCYLILVPLITLKCLLYAKKLLQGERLGGGGGGGRVQESKCWVLTVVIQRPLQIQTLYTALNKTSQVAIMAKKYRYPSRDRMLILKDLARFLQNTVNLILTRLTS